MLSEGGQPVEVLLEHEFFKDEQTAVIKSPENEVVGRAVPQARESPDYQEIYDLTTDAPAVSAERDIDVFLEPGRQ